MRMINLRVAEYVRSKRKTMREDSFFRSVFAKV